MARGKRTIYAGFCETCNARINTTQILKSKKADFRKLKKYCKECRAKKVVKLKEEKHQ